MGKSSVGLVVLVNFPYADLNNFKKRPAIVVFDSSLDTVILCQITSRKLTNVPAIALVDKDFVEGKLPVTSYARPDKLFTVDRHLAELHQIARLSDDKVGLIKEAVRLIFA